MNAIEIINLYKNFGNKQAVNGLNMKVPLGSIYGFIGENGSGKSTTEKMICGLMKPNSGTIKIFDKDYKDTDVRFSIGCLIESPGCFSNYSVWNNLMLQATNLSLEDPESEVKRVLKLVRMEGAASNKYKNCSLGMKQRVGIAMALLGNPKLLVLDEPINGLDADGVRIVREVLLEITKDKKCSVIISSHLLGELEKIATHYGIIRNGKMIKEMTSNELDNDCPLYFAIKSKDMKITKQLLNEKFNRVELDEKDYLRIYDNTSAEEIVTYLYKNNILVNEIRKAKVSLEEYYINLMSNTEGK